MVTVNKQTLQSIIKNQHLVRYVIVGGTTVSIDLVLLVVLRNIIKLELPLATSIAYWTSISYNFTLNRWWTFGKKTTDEISKHTFFYACLLGGNYLFTLLGVAVFSHFMYYVFAKIVTIAITLAWTYPLYKRFVFK